MNQSKIHAETYQGLVDAINMEDGDLQELGTKVILPSNYLNSPRHMLEKQMDAMAIVQKYGTPTFFITITENSRAPGIQSNLLQGKTASDRPDIKTFLWSCEGVNSRQQGL